MFCLTPSPSGEFKIDYFLKKINLAYMHEYTVASRWECMLTYIRVMF